MFPRFIIMITVKPASMPAAMFLSRRSS